MEITGDVSKLDLTFGNTSSSSQRTPELTSSGSATDKQPFTFTMMDVFHELEELKDQMNSPKKPALKNSQKFKVPQKDIVNKMKKMKSSERSENLLADHVSSLNPWSYFNKQVGFQCHNKKMMRLSDEDVLKLAREEIGKRIAYHKARCENNEKRMHVHFRHKLQDLKSRIDRSKAIVLIYVLQNQDDEEIEKLERRLYPFTTRVLLTMD